MSVPAEKLTNAFTAVQENLRTQVGILKRVVEIGDSQLENANAVIKEMENQSKLQNELIDTLSAMNDRYEVLLKERDDFINSLRI